MRYGNTTAWVFDLDNTLYPRSADLFGQMDILMTDFIAETLDVSRVDADHIRRDTWARHGATLTGMMEEHNVPPAAFLEATHRLDLSVLKPDPALAAALGALPGQRVIHTNGPRAHADRVLTARGLTGLFHQVIAIEDTEHIPKPREEATRILLAQTGIDPTCAAMFEDQAGNLAEPSRLGMTTVWVTKDTAAPPEHVTHKTGDLVGFLGDLRP